jgi:hypothetical protein
MRLRSFFTLPIAACVIILNTHCYKSNNNSALVNFYMTLTVDSQALQTFSQQVTYDNRTQVVTLAAPVDNNISVQMQWNAPLATSTFQSGLSISYTDNWTVGTGTGSWIGDSAHGHGTLTINLFNKVANVVGGTFSGVLLGTGTNAGDSLVITNGTFNLPFQTTSS